MGRTQLDFANVSHEPAFATYARHPSRCFCIHLALACYLVDCNPVSKAVDAFAEK